jgi:hypothetical protein
MAHRLRSRHRRGPGGQSLAALYARLEKYGIIRVSTWRARRPESCENKLRGLCWGLTVLPLIRT